MNRRYRQRDNYGVGDDVENGLCNGDVVQTDAAACREGVARSAEENGEGYCVAEQHDCRANDASAEDSRRVDAPVQNEDCKLRQSRGPDVGQC